MSRYYVDSFAYDFDMFMPREKRQDNIVELDRKKTASKSTSKKPGAKLKSKRLMTTVFAVVMLALIVGNIYLRVQVTEVTSKINKAQIENDKLISEQVSLEMKLENELAYKNLEESAKALGMQKAEPYQMNYICSADVDVVEVKDGNGLVTAQTDEE